MAIKINSEINQDVKKITIDEKQLSIIIIGAPPIEKKVFSYNNLDDCIKDFIECVDKYKELTGYGKILICEREKGIKKKYYVSDNFKTLIEFDDLDKEKWEECKRDAKIENTLLTQKQIEEVSKLYMAKGKEEFYYYDCAGKALEKEPIEKIRPYLGIMPCCRIIVKFGSNKVPQIKTTFDLRFNLDKIPSMTDVNIKHLYEISHRF